MNVEVKFFEVSEEEYQKRLARLADLLYPCFCKSQKPQTCQKFLLNETERTG